jgi:hypothetical protein
MDNILRKVLLLMMATASAGVHGAPLDEFPVPGVMRNNVMLAERSASMDLGGMTDEMDVRGNGRAKQAVLFAMQPNVK